jgi:hypothetical protein
MMSPSAEERCVEDAEPAELPRRPIELPKGRSRRSTYGGVPFHKTQPIYGRRFEHKSPAVVAALQVRVPYKSIAQLITN